MSGWSSALGVNLNLCAFSVFSVSSGVSVAERSFYHRDIREHGGFTERTEIDVSNLVFSQRNFPRHAAYC